MLRKNKGVAHIPLNARAAGRVALKERRRAGGENDARPLIDGKVKAS